MSEVNSQNNLHFLITESLDVRTSKRRENQPEYKSLRKALCVGYANQLAERMIRHNGYRTLGFKSQLVQVFASTNFELVCPIMQL